MDEYLGGEGDGPRAVVVSSDSNDGASAWYFSEVLFLMQYLLLLIQRDSSLPALERYGNMLTTLPYPTCTCVCELCGVALGAAYSIVPGYTEWSSGLR